MEALTLDMIKELNINESLCLQSYPCKHPGVLLKLEDGRDIKIYLGGFDLQTLAYALPKEKVIGKWCVYPEEVMKKYSHNGTPRTLDQILQTIHI